MEFLLPLALLACPVGMGVMMWFMMRGQKKSEGATAGDARPGSLEEPRREHARLAGEIDRLEQAPSDALIRGR